MLMKRDVHVYEDLVVDISRRISARILKPNDCLWSEKELCRTYGISRTSVRAGINTLVKKGLLYRKQGRGTFVAEATPDRISGQAPLVIACCRTAGFRDKITATAKKAGLAMTFSEAPAGSDLLLKSATEIAYDPASFLRLNEMIAQELGSLRFFPAMIEKLTVRGAIYGLPVFFSPMVLFINRTLFDRNNLPCPDRTWNWTQFLQTARQLTDRAADIYGIGLPAAFSIREAISFIWQNEGHCFSGLRTCTLADTRVVEAVRFYRQLAELAPISSQCEDLFLRGHIAMLLKKSEWSIELMGRQPTFPWTLAPLPKGRRHAVFGVVVGCMIRKDCRNIALAWQFSKLVNSAAAHARFVAPEALVIGDQRVQPRDGLAEVLLGELPHACTLAEEFMELPLPVIDLTVTGMNRVLAAEDAQIEEQLLRLEQTVNFVIQSQRLPREALGLEE